jgi:hypothetical protein
MPGLFRRPPQPQQRRLAKPITGGGGGGGTFWQDAFSRSVSPGFGTADVGGAYTHSSTTSVSVDGARGVIATTNSRLINVGDVSQQDVNLLALFEMPATLSPGVFGLVVRFIDSNTFYRVGIDPQSGTSSLEMHRYVGGVGTSIDNGISGPTVVGGSLVWVRVQAEGINPTTLRVKAWIDGTSEPGTWGDEVTDSNAAHQAAGSVGFRFNIGVQPGYVLDVTGSAITAGGTQPITLGLISQTAATFTPTVTPGAVTYTPALINQAAATFNPTITSVASISLALINQTASPFTPTVTPGAVDVSLGLINQAAVAFTPTVTSLATISVALIDRTAVASAPTVTTLSTISVALIDQTAATFAPTITSLATISVALIDQTATTFSPTISIGAAGVSVGIIDQTAATFTPTVTPGVVSVSLALIDQTATASAPSVSTDIALALIDRTATASAPTVTSLATISLALIDQTAAPFDPTVALGAGGQSVSLALIDRTATASAPFVINAPEWTTPANNASMSGLPELKFLIPLMPSDMHFHIQIDTANTYDTGNLREIRSDLDQTGWDFWNGSAWTAVSAGGVDESFAGNEARYTVQSALSPASTWYRRVRAGVVE